MALDLKPLKWDWAAVTTGDTFPATNITDSGSDTALVRVRVKVKASGEATASLTLDSSSTGITITNATAGAWNFTIDMIQVALAAGTYSYDLETTDSAGTVRTEFAGTWEILEETTN
jgi:hypothetical protein